MANIGEPLRRIIITPEEEPFTAPSEPAVVPEKEPQREDVPA